MVIPPTTTLLGPPEIYKLNPTATHSPFSAAPITPTTTSSPKADIITNRFTKLMVENFNHQPPMGLTENCSPTFLSTGNPCLDFFFHVVPDTPPEALIQRLKTSWDHDPLKTLKLVCNLRGVRGKGKSDKESYYTAALWLHKHHPKTLAVNVPSLADFGYFKDLPEILFRLLDGLESRKLSKEMWQNRNRAIEQNIKFKKSSRFPKLTRQEKRVERARKVVERFNRDPDFKLLHDNVSTLFADRLRLDLKLITNGHCYNISLAAKWCPSLDCSFDNHTLLCETIAKKVFPREEYEEYVGMEEAHYAYRVRDRLRKQVLVPLRKALELPEVYNSAHDWGSIPYNRVASVAMKLNKEKFFKHDGARFQEYLDKVKEGKENFAAGALLPHEIIASLNDVNDGGQLAELQWERMVDDMLKKGKLNNCLALCNVSGSMSGIPMQVSVALGVLLSELSEEPWKGKLITFSKNPTLQRVEGETLKKKTEFVEDMELNMNTDFQKVFDLILNVAMNGKLKPDEMIKTLFVFSDMEFDQASANPWETDYQAIVRKFKESGYGDCVPEIVFWNLRDSEATPVPSTQPGVALVSGYSKNLMKLILEVGGVMNPEAVMDAAISGDEYKKLVVID